MKADARDDLVFAVDDAGVVPPCLDVGDLEDFLNLARLASNQGDAQCEDEQQGAAEPHAVIVHSTS